MTPQCGRLFGKCTRANTRAIFNRLHRLEVWDAAYDNDFSKPVQRVVRITRVGLEKWTRTQRFAGVIEAFRGGIDTLVVSTDAALRRSRAELRGDGYRRNCEMEFGRYDRKVFRWVMERREPWSHWVGETAMTSSKKFVVSLGNCEGRPTWGQHWGLLEQLFVGGDPSEIRINRIDPNADFLGLTESHARAIIFFERSRKVEIYENGVIYGASARRLKLYDVKQRRKDDDAQCRIELQLRHHYLPGWFLGNLREKLECLSPFDDVRFLSFNPAAFPMAFRIRNAELFSKLGREALQPLVASCGERSYLLRHATDIGHNMNEVLEQGVKQYFADGGRL